MLQRGVCLVLGSPDLLVQLAPAICALSFAIRLRFCAMAASMNSFCAPSGPRNLIRLRPRMRLRWANSISTFLRLRPPRSCALVLAKARATSRAGSKMCRGTRRCGVFGQQIGLKEQLLQSLTRARYLLVSSDPGRPLDLSLQPAGQK